MLSSASFEGRGQKSAEMKSNPRLDRTVQLAFGSAILALLIVGAISYRSMVASRASDGWVSHSHEVLTNLENLLFAMESAEANCREFLLTGSELYLDSYRANQLGIERYRLKIGNLTADNSTQQVRLLQVARLAGEQIQFLETVIHLRQSQGLEAAADAIKGGPDERLSQEFQTAVLRMQEEEMRLLVLRDAEAARRIGQAKRILILGTLLGLVIVTAAGWNVWRDNSARAVAENALREGEGRFSILASSESKQSGAKYRGLLEAAPDAIVVVNQGGEIVLLNIQAEKQFGYRRDELVGQEVKNIIPEGFAERIIADGTRTAAEALAQQIGTGIELVGRRKDGSNFPIEIMLSPLESAEGILVTAAIRDISVRKAAEKHLAQMEGRYRGLLEAAPDAMVVVNQAGDIVLLNVQAEIQFGYRRNELVGQRIKNIIPKGFAERLIADGLRSAEDALAQQIGTGIELNGKAQEWRRVPHRDHVESARKRGRNSDYRRHPRYQHKEEGGSRVTAQS